jgi:predicted ATPase
MVPTTIHDVVMARIDRLPEQTKRTLQMAAVIGREFPLPLFSAVWRGSGSLEDQLRELARLEFVYERAETEGSVYVFRHALTQETAYGSLLERHRRIYHGAVGYALEQLYEGRCDEVAELLALHFGRSDEAEKSVDYAILAAEKSQRRWANSEALAYFEDALDPPRRDAGHQAQSPAPYRCRGKAGRGQVRARPAGRTHRNPRRHSRNRGRDR